MGRIRLQRLQIRMAFGRENFLLLGVPAMRILGFGDSLTAGTPGYEPGYGGDVRSQYGFWILESARREGVTAIQFHNQGVPGELATMMKPRLRRILSRESYDIVVIMAGSNDLGWGYEPDTIYEALADLWSESTTLGIKTIACTIPPIGSRIPHHQYIQSKLNSRILSEGSRFPLVLIADVFSHLSDSQGILVPQFDSGDGLHLSIDGYRQIGEMLWSKLITKLR